MKGKAKHKGLKFRTLAAEAEFESYCEEHPGSPAAVRRPALTIRGPSCVALLGASIESGIVGIGGTARAALRAFDVQYRNSLRSRS